MMAKISLRESLKHCSSLPVLNLSFNYAVASIGVGIKIITIIWM